jgi:acyl-CoA thioesterase FadM
MPRIKIRLPEIFFDISIKIPVRITDINYGNHVGNDSLVAIIHESRMQFLQQYGYTELDIEGMGLIMSEIFVEFKNETFYKDVIDVKIAAGDISTISFELFYGLSTFRNKQQIIIANAKTTMVCYDYKLKKPITIPEKLLDILS